ncbi:MAG: hypothetical protein OET44_06265 [Gammaproteobacteria bacterium]|nr:hypothetical protein [Gammaproteobacteria bacterium]
MTKRKTLALMILVTLLWVAGAPPSSAAATAADTPIVSGGLDTLSVTCLACHDGIEARYIAARLAAMPTPYDAHRSLDHPVGMRYRDYPARSPSSFRYILSLDPSILLVDGRVACVSCHRLKPAYTSDAHFAPMGIGGGRSECMASRELAHDARVGGLCLACHVL